MSKFVSKLSWIDFAKLERINRCLKCFYDSKVNMISLKESIQASIESKILSKLTIIPEIFMPLGLFFLCSLKF